jgi:hypothetical protein
MTIAGVPKSIVPSMSRVTVLSMFRMSSAEPSLSKSPTTGIADTDRLPVMVTNPRPLWKTVIVPDPVNGRPTSTTSGSSSPLMSIAKATVPLQVIVPGTVPVGGTWPVMVQVRVARLLYTSDRSGMGESSISSGPGMLPETGRVKSTFSSSPKSICNNPVADMVPPTYVMLEGGQSLGEFTPESYISANVTDKVTV